MKHILLILVLLATCSATAKAHNAHISSINFVNQSDGSWKGLITTTDAALYYELKEQHPAVDFSTLGEAQFLQLITEHLAQTLKIVINNNLSCELQDLKIQFGHESKVFFTVPATSVPVRTLSLQYDCFAKNPNHFGICLVNFAGITNKVYLKRDNHFYVQFQHQNNGLVTVQSQQLAAFLVQPIVWLLFGLVLLLLLGYFYFWSKKLATY